jgi:hypothetical protein
MKKVPVIVESMLAQNILDGFIFKRCMSKPCLKTRPCFSNKSGRANKG